MDNVGGSTSIFEAISNFKLTEIPDTTRFWIVRTKKGYFYNEFLINRFIALGWNTIDKHTDVSEQSIDTLKQEIARDYKEKIPMSAINKCINFIYNIKPGDILIIPSAGSRYVTFAFAGDYYEDTNKTYQIEKEVISKIDTQQVMIKEVECPYKKRRHIQILKTVKYENINIRLLRALTSYHGISNLDPYAEYILDTIYGSYIYKDKVNIQFNITKSSPIRPREISMLMYGLTEYLCNIVDEDYVSTTLNLNSPGKVKVTIDQVSEKLKNGKWYWVILLILLTGGKGFGFEFPGVVKVIKDIATFRDEIAITKIERELKEVELIKCLKEAEVDINELATYTEIIMEASDSLEVQPEEMTILPVDDESQLVLPDNGDDCED